MIALHHYAAMARYNHWMNEKLYLLCGRLGDDERKQDRGAFFRSLHGTLNHLVLTDLAWMVRFTGDARRLLPRDATGQTVMIRSLDQELYDDFGALTRARERLDEEIIAWTGALTADRLGASISYTTSEGEPCNHPLWWAVSHFFNHQTHHRGQVTALLSQIGVDPGVTDLAAMLRAEASTT
jgi:uncharacterized damage-inducible protein DinB